MLIEAYLAVPLWRGNQLQTTHEPRLTVLLLIFILELFAKNNQHKEEEFFAFCFMGCFFFLEKTELAGS